METAPDDSVIRIPRPRLRSLIAAPLRSRTYLNIVYLGLSFPLGLAYFIFLSVGISLGVGLAIIVVGIPLLVSVLAVSHGLASFERLQARHLLGVEMHHPEVRFLEETGLWDRVKGLFVDGMTVRVVVFLASKLLVGIAAFTMIVTGFVTSGVFMGTPLYYDRPGVAIGFFPGEPIRLAPEIYVPWDDLLVGVETVIQFTGWQVDTLPEAFVFSGLGVVVLVLSLSLFNGFAWVVGEFSRVMLGAVRLREITVEID